jgi:hypothetical protein
VQIGKPDDRHRNGPHGWAVLKASRRESAHNQLQDFEIFASSWFDSVPYRKIVLYNAAARRIDICFQSEKAVSDGVKISLEFSFERDWPVTDESELWY